MSADGSAKRNSASDRASSVFPTPCRPVLACTTHAEANALSKRLGVGINQQTFHLFPKMREVDELLRSHPRLKRIVYEAHPELAFARMNGDKPVLSKKRKPDGHAERRRLLARHGFAWYELDVSYTVIKMMALAGLAWDLKLPPPSVMAGVVPTEPVAEPESMATV